MLSLSLLLLILPLLGLGCVHAVASGASPLYWSVLGFLLLAVLGV
jgi:hypothetical protein